MLVTGDNQISVARQGAGQHMIVVGIVGDDPWHAGRCSHGREAPDLADNPQRRQSREREALGEFLARYHVEQLRHQHSAATQYENLGPGVIKQAPGWAMGRKQRRNQGIRIEDDAHG